MHLSLPKWFPLFSLASSVYKFLQCLISTLTQGGESHLFIRAVGREGHCTQISLVCVGSAHSVWATLGLPLLMACLLSWSTLLRLQVALKWNCLKWAQGCGHFPGLSCSGSGSWVRHKGAQIQLGLRFVPFPGPSSSDDQVLGERSCPQFEAVSYCLPHPSC